MATPTAKQLTATRGDTDNNILGKILYALGAVIRGEWGMLVRSSGVKGATVARQAITTGLTASQTLVTANEAREFLLIDNRTGDALYYRYGSAAATTSVGGYDVRVPAGAAAIESNWTGQITFICGATATTPGVSVSDVSA